MKIASIVYEKHERVALIDADNESARVVALSPDETWLPHDEVDLEAVAKAATIAELPLSDVELLPPVVRPRKLICVAANYLEHIKEGGGSDPGSEVRPQLFAKPPTTTLVPHGATVYLPPTVQAMDYEAELAVVIGKRLYRAADRNEAMKAVAGYTAFNDLSERKLHIDPRKDPRRNTPFFDWLLGKWLDGSAPTGPWIVTADEIADPQNLKIELTLNGEVMQSSSTAAMMSTVDDIVWYASQVMTLEPGDIIATGTPSGVGAARGIAIQDGDTTVVTIEGIGELTTHFKALKDS